MVFRQHRWKAISPIAIDVTIPWSVWVSVTFMHCATTSEYIDISFAYDSSMSLLQIALNFGLDRSTLPPQILPQIDPPTVDLRVGDIRQIAAEWSEIAQWSQWSAYRKPAPLFWMVPSLTPYDLLFTQNGIPDGSKGTNSRRVRHLANTIEDIDNSREMSPFAKSLWPLLNIA